MVKKDVKQVTQLLKNYLKNFSVHIEFSADEVEHFLLPRDGVIYSYVV